MTYYLPDAGPTIFQRLAARFLKAVSCGSSCTSSSPLGLRVVVGLAYLTIIGHPDATEAATMSLGAGWITAGAGRKFRVVLSRAGIHVLGGQLLASTDTGAVRHFWLFVGIPRDGRCPNLASIDGLSDLLLFLYVVVRP